MPPVLVPASLTFTPDGVPYSPAFDDVYHSSEGGHGQARHVFLGGNGLPDRWRSRARFTILETGFGLGLNFLATWAAWKADPARPARLQYVSIELHPFSREDLAQVHARHPEFAALSAELCAAWPMLTPGMHRLDLDGGRVVLTLCFGDVAAGMKQLRLGADALYLDGFAPSKNPGMWDAGLIKKLPKLCAPGATFATYTVAASVREALQAAGFAVEKTRGFASKRDMLRGRCVRPLAEVVTPSQRRALVVGAGLAGSAVCERLASRGWEVDLLERAAGPAHGASGNHAGAFHPLVTSDDSLMAQLSRAAYGYALRHWKTLQDVAWSQCGVLQMPRSDDEAQAQHAALSLLGYPDEYALCLSRAAASVKAGVEVAQGGVWFGHSGWVQPATLVNGLLASAHVRPRFGTEVHALRRHGETWHALDGKGRAIAEAPVVVLANAGDALRLAPMREVTLRRVRGQVSYLPGDAFPPLRAVLLRGGMAVPPVSGIAVVGASYDIDDEDTAVRIDSHSGNLERLARILPGAAARFDPGRLEGRVAFRTVTRDRLPLVGPLAAEDALPGVHCAAAYASRGILWCSLMAELLASRLEGDPSPVEARLGDAVDPGRFARRARRSAG